MTRDPAGRPAPLSPAQLKRNRLGGLARQGRGRTAEAEAVRFELATAKLTDHTREWLRTWEPTPEQIRILTDIYNGTDGQ